VKILFWLSLIVLLHVWVGYLLLLIILSQLRARKTEINISKDIYQYVTVLLTVHNEEQIIKRRITNLLQSDYPKELLEILIASDGSTDKTDNVVDSLSRCNNRITLIKTFGGGKSFTQNKAIPFAKGDIIVLTDAETFFQKDTIQNLINSFSDDNVGCVSGQLVLMNEKNPIAESQGFYWKYEILLRRLESAIGVFHTASGQIMAFRKALFVPFETKYGDDCIIPLNIISLGFKVIHKDTAVAYDKFPSTVRGELQARVRMTLRNITCTLSKYQLFNPLRFPLVSFAIISHKILRWLTPYFMLFLFIATTFMLNKGFFYKTSFYCQLLFYVLGTIGFLAKTRNYRIPIAVQAFSFIIANIGLFLGVLKAITGRHITSYRNVQQCKDI
jgi:cellulose synthase/poly-beta-1,6-N-acetylglucosamine synthase-like glycosyltransferase